MKIHIGTRGKNNIAKMETSTNKGVPQQKGSGLTWFLTRVRRGGNK